MDAVNQSLNVIYHRLTVLESDNENLAYDGMILKEENTKLKKEIQMLKEEKHVESVVPVQAQDKSDSAMARKLIDIQGEVTSLEVILGKVESSHTDVLNEMPALESRLDYLEKKNSLQNQRAGHRLRVKLRRTTSSSLFKRSGNLKLDKCECLVFGSMFDPKTCCILPPVTGCYVVNTHMKQDKEGGIELRLMSDGGKDVYCGVTTEDDDEATCLHLLQLNQGEKVWLEAKRLSGHCKVSWCWVYCWLLH